MNLTRAKKGKVEGFIDERREFEAICRYLKRATLAAVAGHCRSRRRRDAGRRSRRRRRSTLQSRKMN